MFAHDTPIAPPRWYTVGPRLRRWVCIMFCVLAGCYLGALISGSLVGLTFLGTIYILDATDSNHGDIPFIVFFALFFLWVAFVGRLGALLVQRVKERPNRTTFLISVLGATSIWPIYAILRLIAAFVAS